MWGSLYAVLALMCVEHELVRKAFFIALNQLIENLCENSVRRNSEWRKQELDSRHECWRMCLEI